MGSMRLVEYKPSRSAFGLWPPVYRYDHHGAGASRSQEQGPPGRGSPEAAESEVRSPGVDRFRVDPPADPLEQLGVPLVLGVSQGVEEFRVAPSPAAVFGRAGASPAPPGGAPEHARAG